MKLFERNRDRTDGRVWGLFDDLGRLLTTTTSRSIGVTLELHRSVQNGSVDVHQESFNLVGYDIVSERREEYAKGRKAKKETPLLEIQPDDSGPRQPGVVLDRVARISDAFDDYENSSVFESLVIQLANMREKYLCLGLDLTHTIVSAFNQIPEAMEALREISAQNPEIKEMVVELATSYSERNNDLCLVDQLREKWAV